MSARAEWRYKINTALLLIGVTLFSIVISLYVPLDCTYCNLLFYRLAVCVNTLCIILWGLILWGEILLRDRTVRLASKHIRTQGRNLKRVGNTYADPSVIKFPKIFVCFQYAAYALFLVMIILYTAFALTK